MKMMDPHAHINTLYWGDLRKMKLAGIDTIITPALYCKGVVIKTQTMLDFYERLIKFDAKRAEVHQIKVYLALGINPVTVPENYEETLDKLPDYLKIESVVGLGEIGLEPSSAMLPDMDEQKKLLEKQFEIAKDYDLPAIIHTPEAPEMKERFVKEMIEIAKRVGIKANKLVFDHARPIIFDVVSEFGANIAITVQPWRKLTPDIAAKWIREHGTDHIWVDSDCGNFESDPLSVPKTALEMKLLGMEDRDIEKVIVENPSKIFNIEE
jgi:hypothetical protein